MKYILFCANRDYLNFLPTLIYLFKNTIKFSVIKIKNGLKNEFINILDLWVVSMIG